MASVEYDSKPSFSSLNITPHNSSFRDPSGFIFSQDNKIYRQINKSFADHYDFFIQSGLYAELVELGWLISHTEMETQTGRSDCYKIIEPEQIPIISYPYEWSFSQLKSAAILTLQLAQKSLKYNMILKDASSFNIQFHKGKPVFIDTLSFEKYEAGKPWIAYHQFCRMFLAPLALMSYHHEPIHSTLMADVNGIPLQHASAALPLKSYFNTGILFHLHFQTLFQQQNTHKQQSKVEKQLPKQQLLSILKHLENTIRKLTLKTNTHIWGNYYKTGVLDQEYVVEKSAIINSLIKRSNQFKTVIDLGSNNGHFSKLLANKGFQVTAIDSEHVCINDLHLYCEQHQLSNILPLLIDITNPTPALGWMNTERDSFIERVKSDIIIALAVIHHLVIGKNIPFYKVAQLCAHLCDELIIEFVPKFDPKVQLLLLHREDTFTDYTNDKFLAAFCQYFTLKETKPIQGTGRVIYRFVKL